MTLFGQKYWDTSFNQAVIHQGVGIKAFSLTWILLSFFFFYLTETFFWNNFMLPTLFISLTVLLSGTQSLSSVSAEALKILDLNPIKILSDKRQQRLSDWDTSNGYTLSTVQCQCTVHLLALYYWHYGWNDTCYSFLSHARTTNHIANVMSELQPYRQCH